VLGSNASPFLLEFLITYQSVDAITKNGVVIGDGSILFDNYTAWQPNNWGMVVGTIGNLDTSNIVDIDFSTTWSAANAGLTFTMDQCLIEYLQFQ